MRIPGVAPKIMHVSPSARRDVLLLAELFLLNCFVFSRWPELGQVSAKPLLLLNWLYGLGSLIPLAWRDRAPIIVLTCEWLLTVAAWPIMPYYTPVAGIPVAVYAVSVYRDRTISLLALLASFIPNMLSATVVFRSSPVRAEHFQQFIATAILLIIVTVGAWGAGRVTRAIQQHVQSLEREREVTRQAEAVGAERRRIARELHDIVSHAVTVMVLQAAGAARTVHIDLAQVIRSLNHIEVTGRQAMDELRRLLGVLGGTNSNGDLGKQYGLADLPILLTSFRDAGLAVAVHIEGTPGQLVPSVDLAAYRIVQEGLTNVLKHAGKSCKSRLQVVWAADNLLIQIDNDTNPVKEEYGRELSIGRGLAGLRERTLAVGGDLHAGSLDNGGYRLVATLPVAGVAQGFALGQAS